jgi:hypothetical protein
MFPSVQSATLLVLWLALAVVLIVLVAVWRRLRALPLAETARLVEDLAKRQRELEALWNRMESARSASADVRESADAASTLKSVPGGTRRVDRAESSAVAGPTLIAVPNLAASATDGPASVSAELSRKFGTIWAQADAGASAEAIAQSTGQPIGQVELILGLRRQLAGNGVPTNTEGQT